MPENIRPASNTRWDGDDPRVVIRDQVVRGPSTGSRGVGNETLFVDLKELEAGFVDGGASTVAGCQVINDRSFVRGRPCVPFHRYGSTS